MISRQVPRIIGDLSLGLLNYLNWLITQSSIRLWLCCVHLSFINRARGASLDPMFFQKPFEILDAHNKRLNLSTGKRFSIIFPAVPLAFVLLLEMSMKVQARSAHLVDSTGTTRRLNTIAFDPSAHQTLTTILGEITGFTCIDNCHMLC
jgi:hypothetical protein